MKNCLHNATYNTVNYFGNDLLEPCGGRIAYMENLIDQVDNITAKTCTASSWQEACPGSTIGLGKYLSLNSLCYNSVISYRKLPNLSQSAFIKFSLVAVNIFYDRHFFISS